MLSWTMAVAVSPMLTRIRDGCVRSQVPRRPLTKYFVITIPVLSGCRHWGRQHTDPFRDLLGKSFLQFRLEWHPESESIATRKRKRVPSKRKSWNECAHSSRGEGSITGWAREQRSEAFGQHWGGVPVASWVLYYGPKVAEGPVLPHVQLSIRLSENRRSL